MESRTLPSPLLQRCWAVLSLSPLSPLVLTRERLARSARSQGGARGSWPAVPGSPSIEVGLLCGSEAHCPFPSAFHCCRWKQRRSNEEERRSSLLLFKLQRAGAQLRAPLPSPPFTFSVAGRDGVKTWQLIHLGLRPACVLRGKNDWNSRGRGTETLTSAQAQTASPVHFLSLTQ